MAEVIELVRECKATRIPAGDPVVLPAGSKVNIKQALGGSVTVIESGALYRIEKEETGALGETVLRELNAADPGSAAAEDAEFSTETLWNALRSCYDPEIPVNIVDLGLIYDLHSKPLDDESFHVSVTMTLTAQGCGMGPTIAADAKSKLEAIPEVEEADVQIVWDPQWTPHMISPAGKKQLGLD